MANEVAIGIKTSGGSSGAAEIGMLTKSMERLNERLGGMARTSARTTKATSRDMFSMGRMLRSTFVSTVAGAVSLDAAIRAVGASLSYVRQQSDKAAAGLDQLAGVRRRLAQISEGSEDLEALEKKADELSIEYGLDPEESRRLLFAARSEGFEDSVDRLAEASPVVSTDASAIAAGQVPQLFQNRITPLESINALLAAAKASRLDFETLSSSLPIAAEGGSLQNADPEEVIALSSVLASRFKSGEQAGARIRALSTKFSLDEEFAGIGVLAAVEKLQQASEERRRKFLGESQEVNVAYKVILEEMSRIRDRVKVVKDAMIRTGTEQSEISRQLAAALDESTEAGRTRRAELQQRKSRERERITASQKYAVQGVEKSTAVDEVISDLREGGATGMQEYFGKTAAELVRTGDAEPEKIKAAAVIAAGATGPVSDIVSLDPERMAEGTMRLAVPGHMITSPQIPTGEQARVAFDKAIFSNLGAVGMLAWLGRGLGTLGGTEPDLSELEAIEQFTPEQMRGLPEGLKTKRDIGKLLGPDAQKPPEPQPEAVPVAAPENDGVAVIGARDIPLSSTDTLQQLSIGIGDLREEIGQLRQELRGADIQQVAIVEDRTRREREDIPLEANVQDGFGNKFVPIG